MTYRFSLIYPLQNVIHICPIKFYFVAQIPGACYNTKYDLVLIIQSVCFAVGLCHLYESDGEDVWSGSLS
jgi:hypothetical protein